MDRPSDAASTMAKTASAVSPIFSQVSQGGMVDTKRIALVTISNA